MRSLSPKLKWIKKILRLHLCSEVEVQDCGETLKLTIAGQSGAIEFTHLNPAFALQSGEMPCTHWDPRDEGLDSILGMPLPVPGESVVPVPLISKTEAGFRVHYDVIGLTYWMLARIEEIDAPASYFGDHQRILGTASHAFRHQYLERPIVDEWMHILRQLVSRQWPGLELVQRQSRTLVSCDVDVPFSFIASYSGSMRRMLGDLFLRFSLGAFRNSLHSYSDSRKGSYESDASAQGVEYIMDVNERAGNSVVFYFIMFITNSRDGMVNLADRRLRTMFRQIRARGHTIGIHPGYMTYLDAENFRKSVDSLRRFFEETGIEQEGFGGRQHYLRWATPETARLYSENGLSHDSSLGYADRAGFRCGTCWEYPMFDHPMQQELNVMQRPLVLMEDMIINERYMSLGYTDQALDYMCRIRETCRRVSGDFTLLWHNTYFKNAKDKVFYETLIA